jgi:hypothetical protein
VTAGQIVIAAEISVSSPLLGPVMDAALRGARCGSRLLRPSTEGHRWLVAQRRSDETGWHMHDGDHATLHDARAYVDGLDAAVSFGPQEHEPSQPRLYGS